MNEVELANELRLWIQEFVSTPNKLLNNWPPCPFAGQAYLSNQVEIQFHNTEDLESFITSHLYKLTKLDVIIFCIETNYINVQDLSNRIEFLNKSLSEYDIVLLEDHPNQIENLNGVIMNFGKCILVFAQKLSKLNDASKQLKEKGYYANWPAFNLENVVDWRNK